MIECGHFSVKKLFVFSMAVFLCHSVYGATNQTIARLVSEKNEKLARLEQCTKKVTGFKIAGISTLGLTAAGVAGNVVLASKRKALDEQIAKTNAELADKNAELEKLLAQIPAATPTTTDTSVPDNGTDFSLLCEDHGKTDCKLVGKKIPVLKHSCDKDMKLEPGSPIFLPLSGDGISDCYTRIHELVSNPDVCDVRRAMFEKPEHSILVFCAEDANVVYADDASENLSYDEKRCTGSFGTWNASTKTCSCPSFLHLENGECLCGAETGFKYAHFSFGTPVCDWDYGDDERAHFVCTATGGRKVVDGKCICPTTMKQNSKGTYCECKPGTDYIDPTRKSLGCK